VKDLEGLGAIPGRYAAAVAATDDRVPGAFPGYFAKDAQSMSRQQSAIARIRVPGMLIKMAA
jgi:hypothetical protein